MNTVTLASFPVIALLALSLSLPRFVEGMAVLSGNAALDDMKAGVGDLDSVAALARSRERTVSVIDRGKYHGELSSALELLGRFEVGDQRKATLDRAIQEAERGVTQAPADAIVWYRLAKASFERYGANQKAVDAVLSSIAIGPYESELMVPRLDILFASRSYLNRQLDDLVDNQVRIAWKRDHASVVRIIRRNGAADIVRRGLAREPSMADFFDETVAAPSIR